VAVNLRGIPADVPARGMALIDAGRWTLTRLLDVRLSPGGGTLAAEMTLPPEMTLHVGSARTQVRVRPLGPVKSPAIARLTLRDALPLHVGDRVLLRDPGAADLTIVGATVLDLAPPALARRGAAAAAARELAAWPDRPSAADLLRRHGFLRASALAAMGVPGDLPPGSPPPVRAKDWLADPARWAALRSQLAEVVTAHAKRDPLAIGMAPEAARAALGLPDRALVEALAEGRVRLEDGYLRIAPSLPPQVVAAVQAVLADLEVAPFLAPDAARLREVGLDPRAIAAAARAGLLLRVTEQIVLAPDAEARAARVLAGLPQPFTAAEARQALGTTRRVAIPLLEYLDRAGITKRLPDDRRRLRLIVAVGRTAMRRCPMAGGRRRAARWRAGSRGAREGAPVPGRSWRRRRIRAPGRSRAGTSLRDLLARASAACRGPGQGGCGAAAVPPGTAPGRSAGQ
jgi:selenocysteine-specific elongation factor